MSPDPFFQLDALRADHQSSAGCEQKCPFAERGCFCGARIHAECLHIGADNSVRVSLAAAPEEWFAVLHELGEVLHLTRNNVAVLGQLGPLPPLCDWRNPVLPRDCTGRFAPNLAEYASLRATREISPVGTAYGLEARDATGHAFQKIVLTAPARREVFESFVTAHQSPVSEAGNWFSPNHAASRERCRVIAQRIPYLRARLARGATHIRQLPVGAIPRLLTAAARARIPIRTTHFNRALNVAAVWTPDPPDAATKANDGVEFIHGGGVGLHVFLPAASGVWLWQGQCQCCDKQYWTVEIADERDQVSLAITVGDETLEEDWRLILKEIHART